MYIKRGLDRKIIKTTSKNAPKKSLLVIIDRGGEGTDFIDGNYYRESGGYVKKYANVSSRGDIVWYINKKSLPEKLVFLILQESSNRLSDLDEYRVINKDVDNNLRNRLISQGVPRNQINAYFNYLDSFYPLWQYAKDIQDFISDDSWKEWIHKNPKTHRKESHKY